MKKTIAIFFICALSTTTVANAAKLSVFNLITTWGGATTSYCGVNNIPKACIGESAGDNCIAYSKRGARHADEYAILMMVAYQITERGAQFCPIQIDAPNNDKKYRAWTEYRMRSEDCIWLCRDGYTGATCDTTTANFDGTCDQNNVYRDRYTNLTLGGGTNIEDSIPLFYLNEYPECNGRNEEHDMALMISRWLSSGNGAFVRQMMVRSQRNDKRTSGAAIYPAKNSPEILVCKNGYKPNSTKTDCEPIDPDKCGNINFCNGYTKSKFNSDEHKYYSDSFQGCYRYVCKETGYALTSTTDHSCTECATNMRGGPDPFNGTCVKCETGTIFNKISGKCDKAAIGLSKTDMMYGRGKTKTTNPEIENQCWTKTDTDEYKNCVLGKKSSK